MRNPKLKKKEKHFISARWRKGRYRPGFYYKTMCEGGIVIGKFFYITQYGKRCVI